MLLGGESGNEQGVPIHTTVRACRLWRSNGFDSESYYAGVATIDVVKSGDDASVLSNAKQGGLRTRSPASPEIRCCPPAVADNTRSHLGTPHLHVLLRRGREIRPFGAGLSKILARVVIVNSYDIVTLSTTTFSFCTAKGIHRVPLTSVPLTLATKWNLSH